MDVCALYTTRQLIYLYAYTGTFIRYIGVRISATHESTSINKCRQYTPYLLTPTSTHTHTYLHLHTRSRVYEYIEYIYIYIYICTCIYIYHVYIYMFRTSVHMRTCICTQQHMHMHTHACSFCHTQIHIANVRSKYTDSSLSLTHSHVFRCMHAYCFFQMYASLSLCIHAHKYRTYMICMYVHTYVYIHVQKYIQGLYKNAIYIYICLYKYCTDICLYKYTYMQT